MRVAPEDPWAWEAGVVVDAAFARYLREAADYAGGRREVGERRLVVLADAANHDPVLLDGDLDRPVPGPVLGVDRGCPGSRGRATGRSPPRRGRRCPRAEVRCARERRRPPRRLLRGARAGVLLVAVLLVVLVGRPRRPLRGCARPRLRRLRARPRSARRPRRAGRSPRGSRPRASPRAGSSSPTQLVLALELFDLLDAHLELVGDPGVGSALAHPGADLIEVRTQGFPGHRRSGRLAQRPRARRRAPRAHARATRQTPQRAEPNRRAGWLSPAPESMLARSGGWGSRRVARSAKRKVHRNAGSDAQVQPEHHDRGRHRGLGALGDGREGADRHPGAAGDPRVPQGDLPRDPPRRRPPDGSRRRRARDAARSTTRSASAARAASRRAAGRGAGAAGSAEQQVQRAEHDHGHDHGGQDQRQHEQRRSAATRACGACRPRA